MAGTKVTIFECRPPWSQMIGPGWTRVTVAQLRFDPRGATWALYYADRNSRWHPYSGAAPTPDLDQLLAEIDSDPTGIFWG